MIGSLTDLRTIYDTKLTFLSRKFENACAPARYFFLHFRASPEYSDILWYDLCMILAPLCTDISTRGSFYLDAQEVRVTMRARAPARYFFLKSSMKNRQSHFHPPTSLFLDPFMTLEHIKTISGPLSLLIVEILRVSGSPVRTLSQRISAYFDGFTLIFATRIDQFLKSWSRFEGLIDIFKIEPI